MRAIALLPAVTGAWRDVGGGLARSTQVYFEAALNFPTERPERRTFNMAALGSVLTDPGLEPPIRSLIVHNSNPAVYAAAAEAAASQERAAWDKVDPDTFAACGPRMLVRTA